MTLLHEVSRGVRAEAKNDLCDTEANERSSGVRLLNIATWHDCRGERLNAAVNPSNNYIVCKVFTLNNKDDH